MIKKIQIIVASLFLIHTGLWAQDNHITGKIIDGDTKEPLIGANILISGTVNGTISNVDGGFELSTKSAFPLKIIVSLLGYQSQELLLEQSGSNLDIQLKEQSLLADEVVVTASRVEESILQSPVAIEKLDARSIRESAAPTYFDALEAVKGVQMTTLSLGFKVPNTRGFANTTNPRFLQMVDGADTQAPGLGVSIANTVGPTELDVESVEILPGASSALYGMSALNGMSNAITKSPFLYQGLSLYQRTGVNHVDGKDYSPQVFTETALRYAKSFKDKIAFKINVGYLKGKDWVADDRRLLDPVTNTVNESLPANSPGADQVNGYGNESSNRRTLTFANGQSYEIRRTGYFEKDLVNKDYDVQNIKLDVALHYRITEKLEASYTYRVGVSDAIYQRGNRIRLDGYQIQQHKLELKNTNSLFRAYWTLENTDHSYNIRPIGENIDKAFKSDNAWYTDYRNAFNQSYNAGAGLQASFDNARTVADAGRLQPNTPEFNTKLNELSLINNWDIGGQLIMQNQFYHLEAQHNFKDQVKFVEILIGADFRDFIIKPEGNSFSNPDRSDPFKTLHYAKVGGFVQLSKKFLSDKLKLVASLRVDKSQYFDPVLNPRIALVYTAAEKHNFRFSYQNGYRFPTIFEGFSTVNNGGVIRYGGLDIMSQDLRLFENSYIRSSVDAFQRAITADVNGGKARTQAIIDNQKLLQRNEYTYLKPEEINAFDFGYKSSVLNDKLIIDLDFYYNMYNHFIDQVEISVPNKGTIGNVANGVDSTIFTIADATQQKRYRMWTNAKSTYFNYGFSLGLSYNFFKKFIFSTNTSYARLDKVDKRDAGLETSFNTPQYIFNASLSNRELFKNFGFNVSWRWQSAFDWKAPLANGVVPEYSTLDMQVSYKIPQLFATAKLGATNLLNQRYTQYTGGPSIGGMYYLSLTFDGFLK